MTTTETITFSNEKWNGTFEYNDGEYVIRGNATANLADNVLTNVNGQIRKDEEFLGNFSTSKAGNEMRVNISDIGAANLAIVSPVVIACIAKIEDYYKTNVNLTQYES